MGHLEIVRDGPRKRRRLRLAFGIKPEADGVVVALTQAARLLKARGELAVTRTPKQKFLAWLDQLGQPPATVEISTALRTAAASLPESAFAFDVRLRCHQRDRAGLPDKLRARLRAHQIDAPLCEAEALRRQKQFGPHDALKALSSLIEQRPGDHSLARAVGLQAMAWGLAGQAQLLLRHALVARPWQSSGYYLLARCLVQAGRIDLGLLHYELALHLSGFNRIIGIQYTRLLRGIVDGRHKSHLVDHARMRLAKLTPRFLLGEADLVVLIDWNTDETDVDLHVVEPGGEVCFYSHPRTKLGGLLSEDVTGGFGPEMYLLREAAPGRYRIQLKYFSENPNRESTTTQVQVTVIRDWGRPQEQIWRKSVRLNRHRQLADVIWVKIDTLAAKDQKR